MKQLHIRLSHSALETFLTCERKFQLDRLLEGGMKKEDTVDTVFGKSFGEGVASYLYTGCRDTALFQAFLAYNPVIESEKKTEEICYNLLINSFPVMDNLLQDWEVAVFQDKPAVELSFRLNVASFVVDIEGEATEIVVYFVGYIDVVLKNRWTGRYAILENKTTGLNLLDIDPLYKNSGQALGYSIVLDKIAGEELAEYDVIYLVGQLMTNSGGGFSPKVHTKEYPKTLANRLNWFLALGMDVNRLHQMLELGVFPMRGGSCLQFMKACPHLGTCNLFSLDKYKELPVDTIEYQFTYELQDLITDHIQRSI